MTEMKAGRELDELVATRVLGIEWEEKPVNPYAGQVLRQKSGRNREDAAYQTWDGTKWIFINLKPYSTSIEAAWEVVDRIKERFTVSIDVFKGGHRVRLYSMITGNIEFELFSVSAPVTELICKAALKAVGAV